MPALGADMESGTLVEWLVQPGARVQRGQIAAVVETQKGAVEVEIWDEGVIERLLVQPGTRVPVGAVLATLAVEDTPAAALGPPPAERPAPTAAGSAGAPSAASRVRASPAARTRAGELGIDLAHVTGTGPGGAVSLEDVERRAQAVPPPAPRAAAAPDKAAAMRQAIAAAMTKSKREIPHYYLGTHIDVAHAQVWLAQGNAKRPVRGRVLFAAVLLKAVAVALQEVPELNGFWVDGAFRPATTVHLGVGIALRGGGLIAPAIHDVQQRSVPELMAALGDLIERARSGSVRSSELADATVTVTNLGDQGVEAVYGVIYPPQVALVGFGRIVERPWADNGSLCVRPVLQATLSADHRASVGHRGALFLAALDRLLQSPETL